MLQTIIKQNSYQDSVVLMLLTSKINQMPEVSRVSIMMGTPANKDIFIASGFETDELAEASANDMVIMLEMTDEDKTDAILTQIDEMIATQSDDSSQKEEKITSWKSALKQAPDAKVAVFSIPGSYVALEVEKALDYGLNAFVFSDNVPIEDEIRLKQKAHEKGLIVMGPDCGTGIIHSLPLAFTNNIRAGKVGIVGASGTGIQEVSTLIHRYGGGVTNAIGTGGRDLSSDVGAISMIDAILALNEDENTEVITVISKPPAKEIEEKVMSLLRNIKKPIVTIFLGVEPEYHEEDLYHAFTLDEAAQLSAKLVQQEAALYQPAEALPIGISLNQKQTGIRGYYAGGTLAYEAAFLIEKAFGIKGEHPDGYVLKTDEHEVIDLGDDQYTQGKPHPMIDPENRMNQLRGVVEDETAAVVMFDIVLGYGAHKNMAQEFANVLPEIQQALSAQEREVAFIATIVGTELDIQNYQQQKQILEACGVTVCQNNVQMIQTALAVVEKSLEFATKEIIPRKASDQAVEKASPSLVKLLAEKPEIINVGLRSFTESVTENNGKVVQFDWQPSAGGNVYLQKVLHFLDTVQLNDVK
ncbi:acyl-CoA synthetase FdrA [Enterococcus sp. 669A]|uniref:Acyl-CoA synthetase FdrA n=1 Tax=Candidatus Enterococcus moelleringii TaxID=2815325 RepID=A0ABS3LBZ5_9ENTE|nr:acyl-CoA synthetase FdrA [Enterococcus sp. 669A]MBO1305929.1 acyl-CoA synthetase FdrA [Enterococcus sp. 669A]